MRKIQIFVNIQRFASSQFRFMLLMLFIFAGIMTLFIHSQVVQAAQTTQVCANGQQISLGKYYLFNNIWGASTGTGEQCIWDVANNGSSIDWSTRWNWSGQFQVKSYDSVVLGWHWQKQTTTYLTGLPQQLSSNQPVKTNWTYSITQIGPNTTFNIAYDLWLHTISNPNQDNPSDEVMLWLYEQGGVHPVGSPVATVNMDGTSWTLWEGSRNSWQVHTFVRSTNTTAAQSLNLSDFLNYLISNRGLSSAKYLTGVEAGSEVWLGNAELDTSSYSTDIGNVVSVSPLPTPISTPTPSSTPVPSPTLTPTPMPTPASTPTPGVTATSIVTPTLGVISTSKTTHTLGATPTPAIISKPALQTTGSNWYVVFFLIPVPISIAAYITWRRRSGMRRN